MTSGTDRAQPSAPKASWGTPPAAQEGAGRGRGRGGSIPVGATGGPPPHSFSATAPLPVPGGGRAEDSLLDHAAGTLNEKLPFTNKIKFTDDKVVKVAFVIILICAVTISAAALIVHYPVVSSAFFTVLSLTAGVSLIAIAFQGINNCRKNRKNSTLFQGS